MCCEVLMEHTVTFDTQLTMNKSKERQANGSFHTLEVAIYFIKQMVHSKSLVRYLFERIITKILMIFPISCS
jgi:hypothetical protein